MKSMRCKVRCTKLEAAWQGATSVTFEPVSDNSPENKIFHAATPSGQFTAIISKAAFEALGPFSLGTEYYVDFSRVEAAPSVNQ